MILSMIRLIIIASALTCFLVSCGIADKGKKMRSSHFLGYPDLRDVPPMPTDYPRKKDWDKLEKELTKKSLNKGN